MPMISIIVPVYKVESYIRRCIDSILNQTYTNFELILVDDGSPDDSGVICDEYATKDKRIKVIHKQNGGVSSARNTGLNVAQGDFISFVDSDDWIHPQMFELLIKAVAEYNADAVTINNLWCNDANFEYPEYNYNTIPRKNVSGKIIKENIYDYLYGSLHDIGLSCGLWGMYAAHLYTETRFNETISNNEDMEMACRLNQKLESIVHLDVPVYFYYIGNESATRTALNCNILTMLTSWLLMSSAAISPIDSDKFYYHYIWQFFDYQYRVHTNKDERLIKEFKKYDSEFRDLKKCIYRNRYLSFREKLLIYLYLHNSKAYRYVFAKFEQYMISKLKHI